MESTVEDQERKYRPATDAESGMVAVGDKVVMQAALMPVGYNDTFYETRSLFSTGRTRTYITEELQRC